MNKMFCIHATVSGKVQGVFFRNSTKQKAQSLKLTGWVKNCNDGKVELIACGEQDAVNKLIEWLWQGPEYATVNHVDWQIIDCETYESFNIKK